MEWDSSHNHVTPQTLPNVAEQDYSHSSPEDTEQGIYVIVTLEVYHNAIFCLYHRVAL